MSITLRPATHADLDALLDVQEPGAVLAFGHFFPQDEHPFPRDAVRARWAAEIDDPAVDVLLVEDAAGRVAGFAAVRGDQLLHFGTAVETWGTGLAADAHDRVLEIKDPVRLYVFELNHRARRFYEKLGWHPTGRRKTSSFAPHPVLLEYVRR